jgi:hypothetical protein
VTKLSFSAIIRSLLSILLVPAQYSWAQERPPILEKATRTEHCVYHCGGAKKPRIDLATREGPARLHGRSLIEPAGILKTGIERAI